MLNRLCLVGRLTAEPELRYTSDGVAVAWFSVACDRDYKGDDGKAPVDFINCVAWRQRAEYVANYATKGQMVALCGRLQQDKWTDQTGQKRSVHKVQVDSVNLLSRPKGAADPGQPGAGESDAGASAGEDADSHVPDTDVPDPWENE